MTPIGSAETTPSLHDHDATTSNGVVPVGVLGHPRWGGVDGHGNVIPVDGSAPWRWYVAAEDRWHRPGLDTPTRQERLDGTPVVETRLRVPGGDVVQRIWSVAKDGGYTVMEVHNDSPRPVAVVSTRADVLTARPPADAPVEGIDLGPGAIVLPLAHRTSIRMAIAHRSSRRGSIPDLPDYAEVQRGWLTVTERAGRLVIPDRAAARAVTSLRCDLLLTDAAATSADAAQQLMRLWEVVRCGTPAAPLVPDAVTAAESVLRRWRRGDDAWTVGAALHAAREVLLAADESTAVADLDRAVAKIGRTIPGPPSIVLGSRSPTTVEQLVITEAALVRPGLHEAVLLPDGIPESWWGADFEVYRLRPGGGRVVSFAVRWHGSRPAVLWEVEGPAGLALSSGCDPQWRATEPTGEALWAAPAHV